MNNKRWIIIVFTMALLFFGVISMTITSLVKASLAADLRNMSEILKGGNSTKNSIDSQSVGPTKVIQPKPHGNYTDSINGTFISIGPPKVIKSKPHGNYTDSINGTFISIGPPKVIKSKPQPNGNNVNSSQFQVIGRSNTKAIGQKNVTSIGSTSVGPKPITKEEAQKAEQQANAMLKSYNEKANHQAQTARPAAPVITGTQAKTTNSSEQQPKTQDNSTGPIASAPTGIPGIP
jgi:hypothetical protein